jgi:SAM-dependent methyltransferase
MEAPLYRQMRELEDRHWWFLARRRIVGSVISRLGPEAGWAILDAGCGTGGNLPMLATFGRVVGAEHDPAAAAIATARGAADVVAGSLPDAMPFEAGRFDLVTMLDVLEHIDDDQASLGTVRSLLRPGGHLVLTVPAFPFLWGTHDREHHHKRRYLAPQLKARLEAAGLRVRWVSYYNTLLFPPVALVRLVRKALPGGEAGASAGQELALPPGPVNRLLETIFAFERHWLGRVYAPFGVSLIAVAARP